MTQNEAARPLLLYAGLVALSVAGAVILLHPALRPAPDADPIASAQPAEAPPPRRAPAPPPEEPPPPPPPIASSAAVVPRPSSAACGEGMLLVDGMHCPYAAHRCEDSVKGKLAPAARPDRLCHAYASEVLCEGASVRETFCVDELEYPNLPGVLPAVMVDFAEAEALCGAEGKRLCTSDEWELACEGPDIWPYPTGVARDGKLCQLDLPT